MATLLAYGSLMWDNVLATYDGEKVRVEGLGRAFVGQSTRRWGTPEHPCPQIGLVSGVGCEAVLFHVPFSHRRRIFHNLNQREGNRTRPVRVRTHRDGVRRASSYLPASQARTWSDPDELVAALGQARGIVGTGAEYVRTVIHAMELWEIDDRVVREIWDRVRG